MRTLLIFIVMVVSATVSLLAENPAVIYVKADPSKDMTEALQKAIDKAPSYRGEATEIRLEPGVYNISRREGTARLLHISNTTSPEENPVPIKHIGLNITGISNLTIDGQGAKIVTHGEMTPWVIENCDNITLKNFTIDAADPSVPEMTVLANTDTSMTVKTASPYEIRDGKLYWQGEGWTFTNGIAQIYNPKDTTTLRADSPISFSDKVTEIEPGTLHFTYSPRKTDNLTGYVYQMRHSLRTEVAGLIWRSSDITLSNIKFCFMGNFGIVAQFSSDITYSNLSCMPDPESGRTCTGFADFFQVSGCKGQISFDGCTFAGSHDDPINIHGTHLRITDIISDDCMRVRFMHGQTFGFPAFYKGDTIAITDAYSLLRQFEAKVNEAIMVNDHEMELQIDRKLPDYIHVMEDAVVENLTWAPSVDIRDCYFTLTPTRGILVSTWRPVTITDNIFFRCPMSAILIADDALSWYESGPVSNVTISGNRFIDCTNPVIKIAPEVKTPRGQVHENIKVTDNIFEVTGCYPVSGLPELDASLVKGLVIRNNKVTTHDSHGTDQLKIILDGCTEVIVD